MRVLRFSKVIHYVRGTFRNLHRWNLIQNSTNSKFYVYSILSSHKRTHLEGRVQTTEAPERNVTSISSPWDTFHLKETGSIPWSIEPINNGGVCKNWKNLFSSLMTGRKVVFYC